MKFPPEFSVALRVLPCLIPPYALRLTRVFGTKRVGWVLFAVFSLLAILQLVRAWAPAGGLDPGLTLDLLNFLVPVLLLVSMVHIESVFRERRRTEQQEARLRAQLEIQVQERTKALDQANEELQREISMRKQGEEELRQSKEQYRFLFDENPQPMWIYDLATFRFLAFNAAALRHYGYGRTEFRELTAKDLCSGAETEAFVANSAKTQLGVQDRGSWHHCKQDGSLIEVEVTALGLIYSGRPSRLVLASDVTAQHQMQKQALQAQKMRVTAQVAGGVADRFNKVMATLEADAGALAHGEVDAGAGERLKRLAATAASASGLTRQLLALVARHPMQPQILDLNKLVQGLMGTRAGQVGDKVVLKTAYWDNLPAIAGDPALIQQILQNLVTNAREAMPNGGTLTLTTSAVLVDEAHARREDGLRTGAFVCLAVSDTGCGMTAEVQSRIFEPFFTTKDTTKAAGLGLASIHGLIKQHGGWIEVRTEPGAGTTMTVFFPYAPGVAAANRPAAVSEPISARSGAPVVAEPELVS
jgi:PAS domain S-box-containing protein